MAAQTFIHLQNSVPNSVTVPLTAMGPHGAFTSKVQMDAHFTSAGIQLSFHFDDAFQGVSLPYNLYSVLVVHDGQVVSWQDFTSACRDPGIGFFPGQHVNLPVIKMPTPSGNFQIMVWGRL